MKASFHRVKLFFTGFYFQKYIYYTYVILKMKIFLVQLYGHKIYPAMFQIYCGQKSEVVNKKVCSSEISQLLKISHFCSQPRKNTTF